MHGNFRRLMLATMLTAFSVLLGKYLAITVGPVRVSLENTPVILAGILLGPLGGGAVGMVADLVGCLLVGYAINPVITLGATSIGAISGVVYQKTRGQLVVAVVLAHAVGSIVIKTAGLVFYYGYPWLILATRVPLYLVTMGVDYFLIKRLLKVAKTIHWLSVPWRAVTLLTPILICRLLDGKFLVQSCRLFF